MEALRIELVKYAPHDPNKTAARIVQCLVDANIGTIGGVCALTRRELLSIKGLGPRYIYILANAIWNKYPDTVFRYYAGTGKFDRALFDYDVFHKHPAASTVYGRHSPKKDVETAFSSLMGINGDSYVDEINMTDQLCQRSYDEICANIRHNGKESIIKHFGLVHYYYLQSKK